MILLAGQRLLKITDETREYQLSSNECPQYTVRHFAGGRAVYTTSKSIEDVRKAVYETVAPFPPNMDQIIEQTGTAETFKAYFNDAVKKTQRPSGFFLFEEMKDGQW
jgi:hypothetical protein